MRVRARLIIISLTFGRVLREIRKSRAVSTVPGLKRYILGRGIHSRVVSRRKPPRDSIETAAYSRSRNDGKRIAVTVVFH